MPQGEAKLTAKEPVLVLVELMVKREALPSVSARGSARTTMSAQLAVEGLTRGGAGPVKFSKLTETMAAPPFFLIVRELSLREIVQALAPPPRLVRAGLGPAAVAGAGVGVDEGTAP